MKFLDSVAFDDGEEAAAEPFRVTPGFIAFLGMILSPAILAVAVYFGAWMVSDEVYAAQRDPAASDESGFAVVREDGTEVSGWKRTLVSICPAH